MSSSETIGSNSSTTNESTSVSPKWNKHHDIEEDTLSSIEKENLQIPLSSAENLAVGAAGGALETCLQMPILTYKFCLQEGRALPTNISGWYRGVAVQAGTVAPITAIQFMVNGMMQKLVRTVRPGDDPTTADVRKLSDLETMVAAASAGIISSSVYGPVDLITIQQQKLEKSVLQTGQHLLSNYGLTGLFRGVAACATREAIYTAGYLGLAPVLTAHIVKDSNFAEKPFAAGVLGACLAGTTAAILTHPVDTVKTCIQSDMTGIKWPSTMVSLQHLYKEGGLASLYKGMIPRTIRTCGAFFVCMTLQDAATRYKNKIIL